MKKTRKLIAFAITSLLFSPLTICAKTITNSNYNILKENNYSDDAIKVLDEVALAHTLDMIHDTIEVSSNTTFVKIETKYDKNGDIIERKEKEITEDEYNNANINNISPMSNFMYHETSYKKLETHMRKYRQDNRYWNQVILNWKKMPSKRSVDILAHRLDNVEFDNNPEFYSYLKLNQIRYLPNDNDTLKFNNGLILALDLSKDNTATSIGAYSEFYVKKINISKNGYVYSTYQHAQKDTTIGNIRNTAYINPNGLGEVFSLGNVVQQNYDQMQGVYTHTDYCENI